MLRYSDSLHLLYVYVNRLVLTRFNNFNRIHKWTRNDDASYAIRYERTEFNIYDVVTD